MKKDLLDLNVLAMIGVILLMCFLFGGYAFGAEGKKLPDAHIVYLNDDSVAKVMISPRGTVLNFPMKPTKVLLGQQGSFLLEYVENDLAISPRTMGSRSNLFVYLMGRRFTFDLIAAPSGGYAIINVRDVREGRLKFGEFK